MRTKLVMIYFVWFYWRFR